MLRTLIELAHIDNEYSKEKENLIVRIIYILNIDFSIYKQLISEFKKNDSSGNSSTPNSSYLTIDECYKFLESTKENSNVEIKKNYRKLVKQYSTDMLSNKELPSDIISFAEEKLKKINIAYEKIEKYRGIK
jgi:DnaJ-domain-containing protein 1